MELLAVLQKIEERGAVSTAHRVLDIARQVWDYWLPSAEVQQRNITEGLKARLQSFHGKNFAAILDLKRLGEMMIFPMGLLTMDFDQAVNAVMTRLLEESTQLMMPFLLIVILLGLALALDVAGASSGLGAADQWQTMGVGVAFALAAGAVFGLALVWTQHETQGVDGRVRTIATMAMSGVVALAVMAGQGGPHWPQTSLGWGGLAALTFLYGTAFTIMFTVLPKLGVSGHSAIMNVEPVFALVLAWAVLGQHIAPIQILGALLVVGAVMALGLRKA
jgi:uncharacterized membrane protein